MVAEFIALAVLIFLSGFFSSSELAYVVSNKLKVELRARKEKLWAKNAQYFIEKPEVFFSTILISNNIINIAFASLSTVVLLKAFQLNDVSILMISSFILLIFGELIPKYFARELPDRFIHVSSIPVRVCSFILYPFVKITSTFSSLLTSAADINEENLSNLFGRDEFQTLVSESSNVGQLDEIESDILGKILDLGNQKVHEAMSPRTDLVGVEISSKPEDALKLFIDSGYSKLLVFEESLDNIKGFIHAYDMFKNPEDFKSINREINFVPETKKSLEMLNEFLDKGVSIAIVVDEFGGTAGIITVEDILEEMLGEIRDEYDVEDEICRQIETNTFVISGKVEIDYINANFNLSLPEGDYVTLGGYITSNIGMIPEQGKFYTIDNQFNISILRSDKKRIELVKLQVLHS